MLQSTGEAPCRGPRTGRSLVSLSLSLCLPITPSLVPAGDVDLLAADKHNALTSHELLSDDGAEATKQVPAAVDHHGVLEHASRPVRHTHTRTITIGTRTAPAASHALRRSTHTILAAGGATATPPPAAKIQLALLSSIFTTLRLGCRPPRPRSANATQAAAPLSHEAAPSSSASSSASIQPQARKQSRSYCLLFHLLCFASPSRLAPTLHCPPAAVGFELWRLLRREFGSGGSA